MSCRAAIAAVMLFVSACADGLPLATGERDATGKQFAPPNAVRSALYVFRTDQAGTPFEFTLDQRQLGALGRGTWLRVDVPAGDYDLRCKAPVLRDGTRSLLLSLAPGTTTYVLASYVTLGTPSCLLQPVAEGFGQKEVLAGKRAQETGGASH